MAKNHFLTALFTDIDFPISADAETFEALANANLSEARFSINPESFSGDELTTEDLESTITAEGKEYAVTIDPVHEFGMFILDSPFENKARITIDNKRLYLHIDSYRVNI